MMMDWEQFWNTKPSAVGLSEFLKQVGYTVQGRPITDDQFHHIVRQVRQRLGLESTDRVLDLCCGNGLVTHLLALHCQEILGIDFSQSLLNVARRNHCPDNVLYRHLNVLNLDQLRRNHANMFNKVNMVAGLQYIKRKDFQSLLENLLQLTTEKRVILLAHVPDRSRKWIFYNTPKRVLAYYYRSLTHQETIGTWWDREEISRIGERLGMQCEFHDIHPSLHLSQYRFDVTLRC